MTGHKQSLLIPRVTGGHDVSVAPEELEPTSENPTLGPTAVTGPEEREPQAAKPTGPDAPAPAGCRSVPG